MQKQKLHAELMLQNVQAWGYLFQINVLAKIEDFCQDFDWLSNLVFVVDRISKHVRILN